MVTSGKTTRTDRSHAPATAASETDGLAQRISAGITHCVADVVRRTGARAVFVYADALPPEGLHLPDDLDVQVFYVTKTAEQDQAQEKQGRQIIRVPNVAFSRFGQIKIAVLLALSRRLISPDDVIVCLTGAAGTHSLDTIAVMHVGSEFELMLFPEKDEKLAHDVQPEVLERVIQIATELGSEGREGKPVGALFVIGDIERVKPLSRQLILNPFRGYPEEQRNILDPALEETVKELAAIDGAFLIRSDGVIESAGTYLKAAAQTEFELPAGLGARHQAAAAITSLTDSIAVTVSESTGTVTLFRRGHIVAELEKPRSLRRQREELDQQRATVQRL